MKKSILPLVLCAALALTGCSSMLEREYVSTAVHPQLPPAVENADDLWVENYPELVSAILSQVKAHEETGTVRLRNYRGDVEQALNQACDEVSRQDPLGAFAVETIVPKYERIVTYYEATISIEYRRTREQVDAVTSVTGSGAIRAALRGALNDFVPEIALRINYFSEDEASILALIRQTYLANPAAALGMPAAQVSLYPDAGLQRIVEVVFVYPDDPEVLREKRDAVTAAARELWEPIAEQKLAGEALQSALFDALRARAAEADGEEDEPVWSTAECLLSGRGDSQGLALAYKLLCDLAGVECTVAEGTVDGQSRYWTVVSTGNGHRIVDPVSEDGLLLTDEAFQALTGAVWDAEAYPPCGESLEEGEP